MDDWMTELRRGNSDAAWEQFVARYRRVVFAAIHHYTREPDDAADIFAWVCEAFRADDLRRLRRYAGETSHTARTSTWLVTVVQHLTIDWFRHRDGRRHLSLIADALPPVRRRIFQLVYLDRQSHVAAYELIRTSVTPALTFSQFLAELRMTHETVTTGRYGGVIRAMARSPDTARVQAPTSGDTAERPAMAVYNRVYRALGVLRERLEKRGIPRGDL